jgi:hypothetical protein
MKTSLVIISVLLIISAFLPVILFIYNGRKNTANTKKQIKALIKGNGITYSHKEIWRKNFIGISNNNKTLSYIHFEKDKPFVNNINLSDIKQCQIIKNIDGGKGKPTNLKSLDLGLTYKLPKKPNVIIKFFNIDDDLSEELELQRIEKWCTLIKNAIPEQPMVKIAS